MKMMWKKRMMAVLVVVLLIGMLPMSSQKVKAAEEEAKVTTSETVKLYVGMVYAPVVCWELSDDDVVYGTVADLKNSVFESDNKKIATIDKKGVVTAKKAGKTKIQVTSDEWSGTINIKVLPIKKVNKKKLVKTVKVSKSCPKFELVEIYDKKDKEVKKGYVKANKEYTLKLNSVSVYKQKNNSKRYVLNYAVYNKKGKKIKNVKSVQVPYEQYLVYFRVCNNLDFSMDIIKRLCKYKKFVMHYEYPITKKKDLRKSTKKSVDELVWDYGWRNTCG